MSKFTEYITKFDRIAKEPSAKLRYGSGGTNKQQTFLGGCCSLTAYIAFLFVIYSQAMPILNRKNPTVQTEERRLNYKDHTEVALDK